MTRKKKDTQPTEGHKVEIIEDIKEMMIETQRAEIEELKSAVNQEKLNNIKLTESLKQLVNKVELVQGEKEIFVNYSSELQDVINKQNGRNKTLIIGFILTAIALIASLIF
jgi:uncharacterized coiled-coil protein SlyX